jgi:hypothetical protein
MSNLLVQGETPPGIRTDINDMPVDPTIAPTPPNALPRRKPWQTNEAARSAHLQDALLQASSQGQAGAGSFETGDPWISSPKRPFDAGGTTVGRIFEARALLSAAALSATRIPSCAPLVRSLDLASSPSPLLDLSTSTPSGTARVVVVCDWSLRVLLSSESCWLQEEGVDMGSYAAGVSMRQAMSNGTVGGSSSVGGTLPENGLQSGQSQTVVDNMPSHAISDADES